MKQTDAGAGKSAGAHQVKVFLKHTNANYQGQVTSVLDEDDETTLAHSPTRSITHPLTHPQLSLILSQVSTTTALKSDCCAIEMVGK